VAAGFKNEAPIGNTRGCFFVLCILCPRNHNRLATPSQKYNILPDTCRTLPAYTLPYKEQEHAATYNPPYIHPVVSRLMQQQITRQSFTLLLTAPGISLLNRSHPAP